MGGIMRKIYVIVSVLAALLLLTACAAPGPSGSAAPTDDEKAALQAQVDSLTGKVEQLQDKVADLENENKALQNDSTVSATEDMTYLLDEISQSGQMLTSFPALVTGMSASGDGFTLTIDRQVINPDYQPGGQSDQTYLIDDGSGPEDVYAEQFTYVYYDGYLMPEIDESFGEYVKGFSGGAPFTVYMLGDQVLFLNEITTP